MFKIIDCERECIHNIPEYDERGTLVFHMKPYPVQECIGCLVNQVNKAVDEVGRLTGANKTLSESNLNLLSQRASIGQTNRELQAEIRRLKGENAMLKQIGIDYCLGDGGRYGCSAATNYTCEECVEDILEARKEANETK